MTCLHNHDQILEFLRKIFLKGFQIYQNYLCLYCVVFTLDDFHFSTPPQEHLYILNFHTGSESWWREHGFNCTVTYNITVMPDGGTQSEVLLVEGCLSGLPVCGSHTRWDPVPILCKSWFNIGGPGLESGFRSVGTWVYRLAWAWTEPELESGPNYFGLQS